MIADEYQFTRLEEGRKTRFTSLAQAMGVADARGEKWLFVSPHDDDVCLGGGLWLQAGLAASADVRALIVTDGRMGYCTMTQEKTIVDVRRGETLASFELLGLEPSRVHRLDYPDSGLGAYQGRRKAAGVEAHVQGYVGLQNSFTHHLRQVRPTRIFLPTSADLHPDHRITHSELMISMFHACGPIWPELGTPLAKPPAVVEIATYCAFDGPPTVELRAGQAPFARKLASIAAYQSQPQINLLADDVRTCGPVEYIRELNFQFYSPSRYREMFE